MAVVNKVYLYDHVRELTVIGDTFYSCKDSGPMVKNTILAHRGIDNSLLFRALGPDRIPYDISCNEQVYARIIDPENSMVVLEKLCSTGPAKGMITLLLDSGDIAPIRSGLYSLVLIRTSDFVSGATDYYIEKPLYSDMHDNVAMTLEVTDQALKSPIKSYTIAPKDWTPDLNMPSFGPVVESFYSSRIPGGRILNHVNAVHSFSTYTKNFTGLLEIWGSLEESPDPYLSDSRWFKIYPSSMSQDIEFIGYTGTQAWSFAANFMWLKFRLIPSKAVLDAGTMEKLIVRT